MRILCISRLIMGTGMCYAATIATAREGENEIGIVMSGKSIVCCTKYILVCCCISFNNFWCFCCSCVCAVGVVSDKENVMNTIKVRQWCHGNALMKHTRTTTHTEGERIMNWRRVCEEREEGETRMTDTISQQNGKCFLVPKWTVTLQCIR